MVVVVAEGAVSVSITAGQPCLQKVLRVGNFATRIVGTERFMEAMRRLELDGLTFRELSTR